MSAAMTAEMLSRASMGYDAVASRSSSINKICYTDPAFLEVERETVFKRTWQYVCHEEKLQHEGSYITVDIQGQPVFVIRADDGQLKAFYNVCKHRAHELLVGEGITKLITCPYHAWTYKLDGSLFKVRRSEFIDNFEQEKVCLTAIRIETFCHLVFINLDPDATTLDSQTDALSRDIMSYAPDLADLTFVRRLTYDIEANWKAVVDNFLECYHCPIAHKDFCSLIDMDSYRVETHGLYSSHMAKAKSGDNAAYSMDGASVNDHAVWFLWPNMALMRYPGRGNFMVWRFYPVSETKTREVFDFFFESNDIVDSEKEAIEFIDSVLQPEDIALVESVQRGMNTPAFEQGRYMVDPAGSGMSEHAVHHFHGLVLDAYTKAAGKRAGDS